MTEEQPIFDKNGWEDTAAEGKRDGERLKTYIPLFDGLAIYNGLAWLVNRAADLITGRRSRRSRRG